MNLFLQPMILMRIKRKEKYIFSQNASKIPSLRTLCEPYDAYQLDFSTKILLPGTMLSTRCRRSDKKSSFMFAIEEMTSGVHSVHLQCYVSPTDRSYPPHSLTTFAVGVTTPV